MKNRFLFFVLIFISFSFHSLFATTGFVLEWEEVEGATSYQIQVRDSNQKIIIDKKVNKPAYELKDLNPGSYEHRVGVYNKFGKISTYTEWISFSIVQIFPPEVLEPKEVELEESQEIQKISITGKNFEKKMKIYLYTSSKNEVPIQQKKILSDSEIQITLNMKEYPVGKYNLLLENSRNKKLEIKDFLKVKPKLEITKKAEEPPPQKELPKKEPKKVSNVSEPYPYWKEAWQSTYFPGFGQWNKEHKVKAVGFGILLVGSIIYYASTVRDFKIAQKKYDQTVLNSASFILVFPPQPLLTLTALGTNENAFQRARYTASLTKQAAVGVWTIYALNILDALLWKKNSNSQENSGTLLFPQIMFYSYKEPSLNQFSTEYQIQWNFQFYTGIQK